VGGSSPPTAVDSIEPLEDGFHDPNNFCHDGCFKEERLEVEDELSAPIELPS
jgi:hypothetical protein